MNDETNELEITAVALKMLNQMSLISYVNISNGFTGLYMTKQLRIWECEAEIRTGKHRVRFDGVEYNPRLTSNISDAIDGTFHEVEKYVKSHPDLQGYWDDVFPDES